MKAQNILKHKNLAHLLLVHSKIIATHVYKGFVNGLKKGFNMGFRINTNIGAMNAHAQAKQTNLKLDNSLQKLSSGLRINKAADDSSGMAIADSLKSQSMSLGQAIMNANDGIGVVQTADGALQEYINIINVVRTKAIQAASDGQSSASRQAIQNDIRKLIEEAQNIADTTSFNGQTLLNGAYKNKSFHIGAYSGETVQAGINDTRTDHVAKFATITGGKIASGVFENEITIDLQIGKTGVTVGGMRQFHVSISATPSYPPQLKTMAARRTSYDNAKIIANAINAVAQTTGATMHASVVELSGSTNLNPAYGVRIDTKDQIVVTAATGISGVTGANKAGEGLTGGLLQTTAVSATLKNSLATVDVTTRENAEWAVTITGYALGELDAIRSEIGSVQSQLESTIRNITVTQVNVTSAESQIRDVDFAKESANFNKQNILAQSGTYAMSQANAIQQNVLKLLQ